MSQAPDDFRDPTDAEGKPVAEADVIGRGTKPQTVHFKCAGLQHRAQVLMSQIDYETRQADKDFVRRFYIEAGLHGADISDPEVAARYAQAQEEVSNHPRRLELLAAKVIAVVTCNAQGEPNITLPELRADWSTEKLLSADFFDLYGRSVINAICGEVEDFFS